MDKKPLLIDSGEAFEKSGLAHRVITPDGDGPFPTVVMIHGRLGNEDVMWIFARTIPPEWQIISVRAIFPEEDGFSWNTPLGRLPELHEMDEAVDSITHFIKAIPHLYQADPEQIYLMGFSQGAAAAFATAFKEVELIQGIASLVGFLPKPAEAELAQRPLKDLPILMAVGEEDETIPIDVARMSGEWLRQAGAWLEYREYPTGHKLNGAGMRKLKSWWETLAKH